MPPVFLRVIVLASVAAAMWVPTPPPSYITYCIHNGERIENGITGGDQCNPCLCGYGYLYCRPQICPDEHSSCFTHLERECCPLCFETCMTDDIQSFRWNETLTRDDGSVCTCDSPGGYAQCTMPSAATTT